MNPIQEFFSRYPDFQYKPQDETMKQFWFLCDYMGWNNRTEETKISTVDEPSTQDSTQLRSQALSELQDAIAIRFNRTYGANDKCLLAWHSVLEACAISPVPETVAECKKV
jgi:hypothetical protein